ncbi:flagellar biosynthesis anti-sigma factor FlgM [Salidesulfovibrio onnuriiensis]|uniref:flagellar biosynthesis anti-sigma factor FlgM n=1 Tax=Salidesulfovibrio onnuriiensis TaxID=2583823 RepID=UPI00202AF329|nr:flagellar biosynthesis anti-sigma factor FlgM [Salidesulfovibrio onnuriiensis]
MDDKWDGLEQALSNICSERGMARREAEAAVAPAPEEDRARKLEALKQQVRAGLYKPDIKDIARLLTSALNQGA